MQTGSTQDGRRDGTTTLVETFQSIRLSHLEAIIETVCEELTGQGPVPTGGFTSEELKQYFGCKGIHLVERFPDKFSVDTPDIVVTYMWLGTPLRRLPSLLRRLERTAGFNPLVWLDVIFNDQRSPQAIARAVANADKLYIRASTHLMIYSIAEYPTFDGRGTRLPAKVMCAPWDRCWCVLELMLRYLAVQRQRKQPTVMLMLEETAAELLGSLQSPTAAEHWVRDKFSGRCFFESMQGRPDDVREIQATLLSSGFFPTPSAFNENMEITLSALFSKSFREVLLDEKLSQPNALPPLSIAAPVVDVPSEASVLPLISANEAVLARAQAAELEQAKAEAFAAKAAAELERETTLAQSTVKLAQAQAAAQAAEVERARAVAAAEAAAFQAKARAQIQAAELERVRTVAAAEAAAAQAEARAQIQAAAAELERIKAEAMAAKQAAELERMMAVTAARAAELELVRAESKCCGLS